MREDSAFHYLFKFLMEWMFFAMHQGQWLLEFHEFELSVNAAVM